MCSIIGSFDPGILRELISRNQHRGNFSWSCSILSPTGVVTQKAFGDLPPKALPTEPGPYCLCHVQAPTGGLISDTARIHPIAYADSLLWHNGIITNNGIGFLQQTTNSTETFDTFLLAKALALHGHAILSEVEGLFACVWRTNSGKFQLFRSKHAKLYVDSNLSISSERFVGSKCINSDVIYEIEWESRTLRPIGDFKTKQYNFIIKGEM